MRAPAELTMLGKTLFRVLDALAASELNNRITLGLILAAMIVSAAMVMRVQTSFTLPGYPGLAMILFAVAGIGAAYLAVQIVRHDRTTRPR